jgi:hypothetical protein
MNGLFFKVHKFTFLCNLFQDKTLGKATDPYTIIVNHKLTYKSEEEYKNSINLPCFYLNIRSNDTFVICGKTWIYMFAHN